jgi:O-antigen/teichoic acid export membrane protein
VTQRLDHSALLGVPPEEEALTIARNLSTRYLAIAIEIAAGLLILPFNLAHFGMAAYGLWMLTATVTMSFSVLNLGYATGAVTFVARYRAARDVRALNEIASTAFFVFVALAVAMYGAAIVVAARLDALFQLTPEQAHLGRIVLLVTSVHMAMGMAFSAFGSVINGFQRYDLNNVVGIVSSLATVAVNVAVLWAGYGLVALVVATTTIRVLALWVCRANAYRVFPGLSVRPRLFRTQRLREITPFSVNTLIIEWAHKINHSVDVIVIGAFLNTTAVAVWSVAQRLAEATHRLTNQLSDVLLPTIVDNDTARRAARLQHVFLYGTRLSLGAVFAIGGTLIVTADPLVRAWVGERFAESVLILQLLTLSVIVRVGAAAASALLKGTGSHRLVAFTNVSTAVVSLTLSVALVRPYGLTGVALATLIPVTVGSLAVLLPAGCRRVGLPLLHVWREAIWPALWPAGVMAAFLLLTRHLDSGSLMVVGARMVTGVVLYAVTFAVFGASGAERRFLLAGVLQMARSRRVSVPVVSEGA